MPISYTELSNSTYLDYDSYRSAAAPLSGGTPVASFTFNVALVLDRANDPTALLDSNWASRQQQLETLSNSGTLWTTYGANQAHYNQVMTDLEGMGVNPVASPNGYVSSAASRTIWVQVNESNFSTLFNTTLLQGHDQSGNLTYYWQGNLSLPASVAALGVQGLWFDTGNFEGVLSNPGGGTAVALPQGPQSLGNSAGHATENLFPQQIAETYHFPLTGTSAGAVATGTIGLVEPEIGSAMPDGANFQAGLDAYRVEAGIGGSVQVVTVAPGGQQYSAGNGLERSLDVGVVTATNPQSTLVVYAGSGTAEHAQADTYTSYQAAIFDQTNNPQVLTSSWSPFDNQPAAGSPFLWAAQQLFVDGALANISILSANGDGGSGNQFGNGVTNVDTSETSLYDLMVGGTSLSLLASATADPTLAAVMGAALAGDPTTIWELVAGGLTSMPSSSAAGSWQVETVWNQYVLNGTHFQGSEGYFSNNTGSGGPDPSQPVPSYQSAFGLTPTTSDPQALVGRGTPDVAADAGGNMLYIVPSPNLSELFYDFGTSAATPLWATLISQFNAIFHDQGLPQLGYMNDLLYIAAAIAPASFNDVTMGSNVSSFTLGGPIHSQGTAITPTGYGYSAGPGYDLVTGLGSPNGLLLARTLTDIAHSQMYFGSSPDMLDSDGHGDWTSGADQTLLYQTMSDAGAQVGVAEGPDAFGFFSTASGSFAWTSRMAEQSLQPDFDPNLVMLFDKQSQGALMQSSVHSGDGLAVSINSSSAQAIQGTLSSPFGFADYLSADGDVRVARPVAVAETAGGQNDQIAIVRLRQDGVDNTSITFYRVDDLNGTINGLHPEDPGYQAALQSRAYQMTSGGTSVNGPGYGNYEQTGLQHVNAGDLIAMQFTNNTHGNTYLGFAQANEMVSGQHVGHLWNYGLNTWGWEDTYGGGDRDYNDLVVGLDFTSASGHGWLA